MAQLDSVRYAQRVGRNQHETADRMIAIRTLGGLVVCNVAREVMRRKHQYRMRLALAMSLGVWRSKSVKSRG